MIKQHLLKISVFSNESLTDCLDSYDGYGKICEIEEDLLDGDDWWYEYAHDAEQDFGNNWSRILITTEDESQGRFIDRNYYLDGVINNNNFIYHDKLFLIGDSSSPNLKGCFSGQIIFNYLIDDIKRVKYYEIEKDESLISLINGFTKVIYAKSKVVDVIYNPSPQSILMMKLSEHYNFIVHISTKEKINDLVGLNKALQFSEYVYHEMLEAHKISKSYGTSELNFMEKLIADMAEKLNPQSANSFFNIFEEKFCL